ncbi:MAG: dicarboxylate/amino acid:cation symporter [Phycisphaeraceae bacterium]|nr:dicarboxylate/amino acid:cation symporter [Phycisphaeraceae bacterium]MCW5761805.1 dicarboxylate/amino acid:cation symporter [Phycisphaeraceae bacterium]
MKRLALHWKILIGLVVGIIVGVAVNAWWTDATWAALGVGDARAFLSEAGDVREAASAEGGANEHANMWAGVARLVREATVFIGRLFMRMLMFIAVPIVLFSLIAGVASLNDTAKLGRIGGKTIGLYLATTAVAITLGLVLANVVGPGKGFPPELRESLREQQAESASERIARAEARPTVWNTVLDIVPENPFSAIANTKMLQVVLAALLVGVGLTMLPREKSEPVVRFFDTMTEVVIKIVHLILILAPYAVFALIVVVLADLGVTVLANLFWYVLTVVAGLLLMIFIVYPTVLRVLTKVGYRRFFRAISPAQLLAFSSSSSGATLPVTMECCEERLGVHDEVNSFVVPIGATINMDGTALYQGVAAVFIAQMYSMNLGIGEQLTIVLTATLASIGTAAVPGVGIVMLVIVLQSVNIPLEGIAVILGIDRLLDMCRTSCNVTGDCMVCAVVATSENAIDDEETVLRRLETKASEAL